MNEKAMSHDGYIIDQSLIKELMYGVYPSSVNGCGWIAAYNVLHFLGYDMSPEDIFSDFLSILPFKGRMGTPVSTMNEFFDNISVGFSFVTSKKDIAASNVRAGILRYAEGIEPHYVAFVKHGEDHRFFNAVEGEENYIMAMPAFLKKHVWLPRVRAWLFE